MKMKLIRKIVKYIAIILLILFFIVACALIFILKTNIGSRYALKVVPGLTIKNATGTLSGGLSAEELIWQNDTIKITASNPVFTWYASCLFKADICIKNLDINQLDIDIIENTKQDKNTGQNKTSETTLPTIDLPISIEINTATLKQLRINKQDILNNAIFKNTTWQQSIVKINDLTLQNKETKINLILQGQLDFNNNWPLTASVLLNLDSFINEPWQLDLSLDGELDKQLMLSIHSKGYVNANINIIASVLDELLPAELTLTINDFFPNNIKDLPETLRVKELQLNTKGNLKKGYNIEASSTLAGHTAPVKLNLKALASTEKLHIQALTLNTNNEQQFIKANAIVNLTSHLNATGEVIYQQFPLQELYPFDSPVDIKNFTATGGYSDNNYHAKLTANLMGPAGNFNVDTTLLGDLEKLIIEKLNIATPDKGNIEGKATITLSPEIAWQSNLVLKNINPNYWVKNLSGILTGNIDSQGRLLKNEIDTTNKINIQGQLNKQPTQIQAQIIGKQNTWQIPELFVKIGSNTLSGNAQLKDKISAKLTINMPRLKQIAPILNGNLVGTVNIAGTLEKPQGNIQLTGNQLAFENNRIGQLQLATDLNNQQQGNLNIQAKQINANTINLGNLAIQGSGNIARQQLTIQLTGGVLKLLTSINSTQDKQKNWLVHINQLTLASFGQNWQLDETTTLSYPNNDELTIDKHCLRNGPASLCALQKQKLLPDQDIHYQLSQFQIESLKHWYPDTFNWKALLSAKMQIKLNQRGPAGVIAINANNGTLQLRDTIEDKWHDIPYKTLSLTADLKPEKIMANLSFSGTDLGNIQSQLTIDPLKRNKPIQGDFSIKNFNISIFRPFITELNELTGNINGQGTIQGSLEKPYLSGKIALTNGTILGDIPISLEKLQTTAIINGESLKLDGSWVIGTEGRAAINGHIDWSNTLNLNMVLKANKLPIIVAPYGNLEADTNLTINMGNNMLNVIGTIDIPKGALKIRELPASTVTVSSDAVIITNETAEEKASPIKINTDIKINIGKEKLSLQGFGLNSDITGNLSVTKNLFTQGDINLNNGIYRAYGQKLKITKAHILFTGSPTEPSLDIEAVRIVDNVTAGIRVTGSASQPKVSIFSTPSMSQDQALSYIIFGRPLSAGDNNILAQAALAIGVSGGSAVVGGYADKIGIHDFELETSGSGDNTSVVASGKINDKLSVHYGVSIFNAMNTLMFRYNLTKSIYLEAASGTASSLDIFYKRSFK